MAIGDEKDMDDATVVASPSFDAMLEARGESADDEQAGLDAAKSHDAVAFAATASGDSYDARLDAMGLPLPDDIDPGAQAWSDEPAGQGPGVPKTMVLSPQQWGLPAAPQSAHAAPQPPPQHSPAPQHSPSSQQSPGPPSAPYAPQSSGQPQYGQPQYGQPQYGQPQSYGQQPAAQPFLAPQPPKPARAKSGMTLFLISAALTLVVFGTCGAGVIAFLLLRN